MADFTLPELGEQIESGDVLRVLVKAGDTIAKDQPVLELETDKATIEVPSSVAGTVKEIKVKAGDKVKVGQAILSYDEGGGAASSGEDAPKQAAGAKSAEAAPAKSGGEGGKAEPAKASDAPKATAENRRDGPGRPAQEGRRIGAARDDRRQRGAAARHRGAGSVHPTGQGRREGSDDRAEARRRRRARHQRRRHQPRRAAGERNRGARKRRRRRRRPRCGGRRASSASTSAKCQGTGPNGRISVDDVKAHVKRLVTSGAARAAARRRGRAAGFHPVGQRRAPADARRTPQDGRAPERGLGDDSRTSRSAISPTSPASKSCGRSTRNRSRPPAAT